MQNNLLFSTKVLFLFLILSLPANLFAQWMQLGADIDGENAGDDSGYSVSLSGDGSRIIIGARNNNGNGADAGHARIYQFGGSDWAQLGTDIDGEAASDLFGYSVAISSDGNRVAIGAVFNDGNGANAGHVRVTNISIHPGPKLAMT